MKEREIRILVADDERAIREGCRRVLSARGYQVLLAENGEEALAILSREPVDIAVVDLALHNSLFADPESLDKLAALIRTFLSLPCTATLQPNVLDRETLLGSVRKTGRLVVRRHAPVLNLSCRSWQLDETRHDASHDGQHQQQDVELDKLWGAGVKTRGRLEELGLDTMERRYCQIDGGGRESTGN